MMSIETRVNGQLIGYAQIIRQFHLEKDTYLYSVEYHKIGIDAKIFSFDVTHDLTKGSERLTQIVYGEISKRLKTKPTKKRK